VACRHEPTCGFLMLHLHRYLLVCFLLRRYTWKQFLCVAVLTFGAVSATFAEATVGDTAKAAAAANTANCDGCDNGGAAVPNTGALTRQAMSTVLASAKRAASEDSGSGSSWFMIIWLIGVGMLTLVLILQTCLGNYQSWVSDTYGRAPNEGMFFMHSMSLPFFLLTLPDLIAHASQWNQSASTGDVLGALVDRSTSDPLASSSSHFLSWLAYGVTAPIHSLPVMWLYVAINVLSQYCCIKGVYLLTPIADPLSVNVALTVRKFISLMLSIYVFNNTFTLYHWLGAVLVFGGALWYGQMPAPPKPTTGALAAMSASAAAGSSTSLGATAGSLAGSSASRDERTGGVIAGQEHSQPRVRVGSLESGSASGSGSIALSSGGVIHHRGSGGLAAASSSS
jgi:UAA transporter family